LCCRGLKESFGGFKFRFQNEELRPEARAKKGVVYEPIIDGVVPETRVEGGTRNTRASRGEFGADRDRVEKTVDTRAKPSILAPPHLKPRRWRKVLVKLGNLIIPKYISDQEVCAELQERQQPKKEIGLKRKKRSSKSVGGVTIGTHEILGEIDEF
jgi:hypothetical protein